MKGTTLLLNCLVVWMMLMNTNLALKMKDRKPPDYTSENSMEFMNMTSSEDESTSTEEEASKKISDLIDFSIGSSSIEDSDELIGQETFQSKIIEISTTVEPETMTAKETTTKSPTTTTKRSNLSKYLKSSITYYPARYLFRLKPSAKILKPKKSTKTSENISSNVKSSNTGNSIRYSNNQTVSEAMLKWRSRYNYIFRRRGSTSKPSYLKKYITNYLVGSESSINSRKATTKPRYRFKGGSNRLRGYTYSSSRGSTFRNRSGRKSSRSRSRSGRRTSSTLSTSGSYRSYTARRFVPPPSSSKNRVPGESNVDYPAYIHIPKTSFSCDNRVGRFPDYEARCQLWHMCYGGGLHSSFLCPNGTVFSPKHSICDWWYMVSCDQG